MQSIDTDLQSLGGGGMGGFGGGSNPLLWLVTLAFLRGNGGAFGGDGGDAVATAGIAANSAKLDCLQSGHASLADAISANNQQQQFTTLGATIAQVNDTVFRETQALGRELAACCCGIKTDVQAVNTSIALSTKDIIQDNCNNTNRILEALQAQTQAGLQAKVTELSSELTTARTVAALSGGHHPQ